MVNSVVIYRKIVDSTLTINVLSSSEANVIMITVIYTIANKINDRSAKINSNNENIK